MSATYSCPTCGKVYEVNRQRSGKRGRCKQCETVFRFPTLNDAPPITPAAKPAPVRPVAPVKPAPRNDRSPSSEELYVADKLPPQPAPKRPNPPRVPVAEVVETLEVVPDQALFADEDDDDLYNVVEPLPRSAPSRSPAPAPKRAGGEREEKRPNAERRTLAEIPRWIYAVAAGVLIGVPVLGLSVYMMSGRSAEVEPDESVVAVEAPVIVAPKLRKAAEGRPEPSPTPAATPPVVTAPPPPAPGPRRVMSTAEIVAECEPSIGQVVGSHKFGTGFLVRPGILATNAHVIEGENFDEIEIRFPSAPGPKRGPFSARLMYRDPDRDVAFLAVETQLTPLRIAQSFKFLKGEDVTVIGSPGLGDGGALVLENAVSRGVVSSKVQLNGHEFLQLGISINHGNSGGPVLDSHGEVIGIATAVASKQEGLAFCVPVDVMRDALESAVSGKPSPPSTRTPSSDPIARAPGSPRPSTPRAPGHMKPGVKAAPLLAYGWKPGETYVYQFRVVYDFGKRAAILEGTSVYRAADGDAEGVSLSHGGWIIGRARDEAGKLIPGSMNGPEAVDAATLKVGPKGDVFEADPKSSLPFLGDLSMFVIEPLPDGAQLSWEESRRISLDSITRVQVPGSGGGQPLRLSTRAGRPAIGGGSRLRSSRGRLQARPSLHDRLQQQQQQRQQQRTAAPPQEKVIVISHPGEEVNSYAVKSVSGNLVTIANTYRLTTEEKAADQSQLTIEGSGTLTFDTTTNLPTAYEYRAKVTDESANVTLRIPITVSFRLLTGEERARAIQIPGLPPTAMDPCKPSDVRQLIANLKSPDANLRRDTCTKLIAFAPLADRRASMAKALIPSLESTDAATRADAYRALGVWGLPENVDLILPHLADEADGNVRDAQFEALGRLQPAPSSYEPLLSWVGKHQGAETALRAAGAAAESRLVQVFMHGKDVETRLAACRILKDVGGPSSMPALESIIASREGAEIGRFAAEAVRQIEIRCPDEDAMTLILADLSCPDGGRVFRTAERLIVTQPVEAHRAEVARKLEAASSISDDRMYQTCLRALAVWGDAQSASFAFALLNDPKFRPRREAIDAVNALSPDDPRLAAAIVVGFNQDPRASLEALEAIGPIAEPALIQVLELPPPPGFNPKDLINVLNRIGTMACVPAIEKAKAASTDIFLKHDADNAIAAITARGRDDGQWLKVAIAELKSKDDGRRRDAIRRLAASPPAGRPTAEVSEALQLSLDDADFFSRGPLLKAVELWGDASIIGSLAKRVAKPDYHGWELALPMIVKTFPDDDATLDLVCTRAIGDRGDLANAALKRLGVRAERKLLAVASGNGANSERAQACRALGVMGTAESLGALRELAKLATVEQLANAAGDALNAIKARQ